MNCQKKIKKEIVLRIIYKEGKWMAFNDDISVSGRTLEDLDIKLKDLLKKIFKKGTKIKIRMEFDYNTLPFWMTQYQPYYFYRIVEYEI